MSTTPTPATATAIHPFGLPLGTVRGVMSNAICLLIWITLLMPPNSAGADAIKDGTEIKVVLAHFFLLGLVLMAFASSPRLGDTSASPFLPWLMRLIFVGASVATVAIAWIRDPDLLQYRLTPDAAEVREWWIPFLACMAGGFGFGVFVRFLFGVGSHIFQTLRAWFSVVGLVMLALELAIFLAMISSGPAKTNEFLHVWQCITIVIVSAYFGTRA